MPANAPTWMIRSCMRNGPGDSIEYDLRNLFGAVDCVRTKSVRDRKLIAAQARNHRILAQFAPQRDGNRFQEPIARFVTVLVVDGLEALDLERDHDEMIAAPTASWQSCAARSANPSRL